MATPSFRQILERLDEHGVEYVVVGGVAAVLRGAPITTFDFDALVKIDPANAERLVDALRALDARYREHPDEIVPTLEDILAGGHLLLMTNAGPLDILGHLTEGKRFEDVAEESPPLVIGELSVRVLGLEALIAEKEALDRPKDRAMAEMLAALLQRTPPDEA